MRELRKVIERSDVIIQVLDARDPEGTRSRWVEEEVRKRDASGKKLLAVVNKIDLVPRANLEAWLKHLRHSFPCMPFKSSTQAQRQHLSQNAVPLATPAAVAGQKQSFQELPVTSSSLGAPALLNLLKQYALTSPHSALTVGVVGYPNVGKSSLINSLKRSRACGVAAMPGKTRVVQEVVLDKGVKILDCPGVVLEDIRELAEAEDGTSRRKQAEMMLRNCVKAELVEDPVAPMDVILERADPELLMKLYNIPMWSDTRDFLIKLALTRGRLGRGGIPDLEAAAVGVLRDWNSGKIPYYTRPPAVHASSKPAEPAVVGAEEGDVAMEGAQVGDAKILNTLSEAFSIEGLFDNLGDEAEWDGEDDGGFVADAMEEEDAVAAQPTAAPAPAAPAPAAANPWSVPPLSPSSSVSSRGRDRSMSLTPPRTFPTASTFNPTLASGAFNPHAAFMPQATRPVADPARLFSAEERAVGAMPVDRRKAKKEAKKAKKRRAAAERTEGELLLGFMGMDVEEEGQEDYVPEPEVKSSKQRRVEKKEKQREVRRAEKVVPVDEEEKKEKDFASFLAAMGEDDDEEL